MSAQPAVTGARWAGCASSIRFCRRQPHCGSTARGKPGRPRRLAIYRGCFWKPRRFFRLPVAKIAAEPFGKLNGNCGGDRGPGVAP